MHIWRVCVTHSLTSEIDFGKCPELCLVYFLAYIGLIKHYVADIVHIKPLYRASSGFVPVPKIGSVQGQDRREPNMCVGWFAKTQSPFLCKKKSLQRPEKMLTSYNRISAICLLTICFTEV